MGFRRFIGRLLDRLFGKTRIIKHTEGVDRCLITFPDCTREDLRRFKKVWTETPEGTPVLVSRLAEIHFFMEEVSHIEHMVRFEWLERRYFWKVNFPLIRIDKQGFHTELILMKEQLLCEAILSE